MSLRYKILFEAELLHEYYSDKESKDFIVVPSPETEAIMRGQGMLHKMLGNRLLVLVKVNDDDTPVVPLDPTRPLSFYLLIENPHFFNITNLDLQPSGNLRYYFSNLNQNEIGSALYLNKKIETYNNSLDYPVGSLSANGSDQVFEAIRSSSSSNQHNLGESDYWQSRGVFQYPNPADLLEFSAGIYQFPVPAGLNFTINIFGFNAITGLYDISVKETEVINFSSPQTILSIPLHGIKSGSYMIQVNSDSRMVYLEPMVTARNMLGVIDIFFHLPASNAFGLLKADGTPKQSRFSLRLANRLVIWQYNARTGDVTAINDPVYSFTSPSPKQFLSSRPMPLQEDPIKTVSLNSTTFGNISPIANPPRDRLKTISQSGDQFFCTEIFLNY